jgi:hypothetical protein
LWGQIGHMCCHFLTMSNGQSIHLTNDLYVRGSNDCEIVLMGQSYVQVVLAPVLVGACIQSLCPQIIAFIIPFSPLIAVLVSSLLASRFVFFCTLSLYIYGLPDSNFMGRISFLVDYTIGQLW